MRYWTRRRKPDNVFVLTTGRSGSVTFAEACRHLTNFSVGHETNSRLYGSARLNYPTAHIEVDNRLSWLLGQLGGRYPDAFFVHLRRHPDAVARSFEKRLRRTDMKAGIIQAFGHGIIQRAKPYGEDEQFEVCRFYVDTVTGNIEEFLGDRPHIDVSLEAVDVDFPRFLDRVGAKGDLDAALSEWSTVRNAS